VGRHTHPERARRRRRPQRAPAARTAGGRPAKQRHRPDRCIECGGARDVTEYQATDHRGRSPRPLTLCARCLRERGAAWRWRWKISGRGLPDRTEAP
jgi:hypothetical protein